MLLCTHNVRGENTLVVYGRVIVEQKEWTNSSNGEKNMHQFDLLWFILVSKLCTWMATAVCAVPEATGWLNHTSQ